VPISVPRRGVVESQLKGIHHKLQVCSRRLRRGFRPGLPARRGLHHRQIFRQGVGPGSLQPGRGLGHRQR